jgi:ATP-dependent phosphofructokinase / diphosphate-dependent phosphofructokinase
MTEYIGVLTSGGDTPGLNAALRGIGKAALGLYNMNVIGFKDGFRGLVENRTVRLERGSLSGILTLGGTILGTSRDKPHRMPVAGQMMDMTDVIVENYKNHHLDALVCLGGGGTQKNALALKNKGLNIITLPKTIDNDVAFTDVTFGFDTALGIAVEAIDRLHSTAYSHHRIIIVEIMGHRAGWLALGAGISGGADVILIPEIPYDIKIVAKSILERARKGSPFSIVAVAEGAINKDVAVEVANLNNKILKSEDKTEKTKLKMELKTLERLHEGNSMRLAAILEEMTGIETRVTILGHLQRGGTPSAADRLLATRLGTACADYLSKGVFGVMVAAKGEKTEPVPLEKVAGVKNLVPLEHDWVRSARSVGTCLGDV